MTDQNNNVFFVSLGCPKNLVDTEVMLGKVKKKRYAIVDKPEDAQIIIINTCSFIDEAKRESIDTILEMSDYKISKGGRCNKLIVTGCLPQRYVDSLLNEMPEVDVFVGTGEYHKIVDMIESTFSSSAKNNVGKPNFIHSEKDERVVTTPSYTSWLKIAEGCDRRCAFCVIPQIRGHYRSRSVHSLLIEAKKLVNNGVKELNLISQDLSVYGKDLGAKDTLFHLLRGLEKLKGLVWIRLMYYYPDLLNEDLARKIKNSKKICSYMDMPIQHFSDNVLKAMNRSITGDIIIEKINMLKDIVPDIFLRTSLIVGFPGETEEDFERLLEGIRKVKFNHVGIFRYSDEENTKAFDLPNKISKEVIEERYKKAYEVQKEVILELNQSIVGKKLDVLIEGLHEETDLLIQGRHQGQAPEIDGKVIINDDGGLKLTKGDLVQIQVSEFNEYDLIGSILT